MALILESFLCTLEYNDLPLIDLWFIRILVSFQFVLYAEKFKNFRKNEVVTLQELQLLLEAKDRNEVAIDR